MPEQDNGYKIKNQNKRQGKLVKQRVRDEIEEKARQKFSGLAWKCVRHTRQRRLLYSMQLEILASISGATFTSYKIYTA